MENIVEVYPGWCSQMHQKLTVVSNRLKISVSIFVSNDRDRENLSKFTKKNCRILILKIKILRPNTLIGVELEISND